MAAIFQFKPTKLTHWASRNVTLAVALLTSSEVLKLTIGFHLGRQALPVFSADSLGILAMLLATGIFVVENHVKGKIERGQKKHAFGLIAKGNLFLFTASLILSMLAGNQWERIENPTLEADIAATLTIEHHNGINGDSLLTAIQLEQQTKQQRKASNSSSTPNPAENDNDGLQRLGYFGLFILSLILTYLGIFLACGLACGGFGVIAALVFLIDIGIFGGGVYFLLKVFKQGRIKRWREMDKAERRKEGKRYLKTTLLLLVLTVFFLLAISSF